MRVEETLSLIQQLADLGQLVPISSTPHKPNVQYSIEVNWDRKVGLFSINFQLTIILSRVLTLGFRPFRKIRSSVLGIGVVRNWITIPMNSVPCLFANFLDAHWSSSIWQHVVKVIALEPQVVRRLPNQTLLNTELVVLAVPHRLPLTFLKRKAPSPRSLVHFVQQTTLYNQAKPNKVICDKTL